MAEITPNPAETTQPDLAALAAQLVQEVRHVRERIPDFVLPHKTQPRLSGRAATVPLEAVEAGFAACDSQEALQKSIDLPATQYDHQFSSIFAELRDEASKLAAGLDHTIRYKRYRVGQAMLRVFNVARTLRRRRRTRICACTLPSWTRRSTAAAVTATRRPRRRPRRVARLRNP